LEVEVSEEEQHSETDGAQTQSADKDLALTSRIAAPPAQSSIPTDPLVPIISDEDVLSRLPDALKEFQRGSERGDAGRTGIRHSLLLAIYLLGSRIAQADKQLITPLMCLMYALEDLDRGSVHPALKPRAIAHRMPIRWDVAEFKGRCLLASDVLSRRGGMSRKQADRAITTRVSASADRLGLRMTGKSLETWRREARKGLDRNGNFKTILGCHVWMYRQVVSRLEDAGYDAASQAADLLDAVSEERLSNLP
jgi:hypothetical protein